MVHYIAKNHVISLLVTTHNMHRGKEMFGCRIVKDDERVKLVQGNLVNDFTIAV